MSGTRGRMILLNGTSSSGKTTLARAIQEESRTPYLYFGIDSLFAMVPPKWGGGRGGPLSRDGFRYVEWQDAADGRELTRIEYGDAGRQMLEATHRAVATLLTCDSDVVMDDMILSQRYLTDWLDTLIGLDVLFVGVHCAPDVLDRREAGRGNRRGLARGQLASVHDHGLYDVEVDTTDAPPPVELARQVLRRMANFPSPSAFDVLRERRR